MTPTDRGLRLGPLHVPVEEEAESIHVKFLQNPPPKKSFAECVKRFNANAPYSGLLYSVTQDVGTRVQFLPLAVLIDFVCSAGHFFRK